MAFGVNSFVFWAARSWANSNFRKCAGNHLLIPFNLKPTPRRTSYAGEYLDLIKGSRYDRNRGDLSDIISIIWEEADTFFEGEKSARDAAKVIQSRVSLYLMEK